MNVRVTSDAGVLTLSLDRASARNALDLATVSALRAALELRSESTRAVVLRSDVPGVFSVGMDLDALRHARREGTGAEQLHAASRYWVGLLQDLVRLPVPTFAEVAGVAVAGGIDLLAACDVVIASREAAFAIPQLANGIFPLTTSALVVPRVGQGAFMHWMLSGRFYSAARARQLGLIAEVVRGEELQARVGALVGRLLRFEALPMRLGMSALRGAHAAELCARLEETIAPLALNCHSSGVVAGAALRP